MDGVWIIAPLVFLAGFIDAIAGGGGLIALPAYLFAGVPIHLAMGTNKLSSSIGTFSATLTFFLHKRIMMKLALISAALALIGSGLGSSLALVLDASVLKTVLIFVLPIMAIVILRPRKEGIVSVKERIDWVKIGLITFFVGMYDGFIGPGTGSLLIFGFVSVIGMNYTQASANAKVVNLASGIAAVVTFGISGQINVPLGLVAAAFSVAGNLSGSLLAIRFGKRVIQPLLIGVFSILMIRLILDVLGV